MTIVSDKTARVLYPFILVFGAYVIIHGHLTPGGGFQGGVATVGAVALVYLAMGLKALKRFVSISSLTIADSLGALMFVLWAFLGLLYTGYFFGDFVGGLWGDGNLRSLLSSGVIALMNISVGLKVLGGAGELVVGLAKGVSEDV